MTRDRRIWWRIVMGCILLPALGPNLLAYVSVKWGYGGDLVRLPPHWLCELDYAGTGPAHLLPRDVDVHLVRVEHVQVTDLGAGRLRVLLPFGSHEAYEARQEYEKGIRELESAGVDVGRLRRATRTRVSDTELRFMRPSRREAVTGSFDRAVAALATEHPEQAARIHETVSAHKRYADRNGALPDPDRLVTILNRNGVLEFRIAPRIPGGRLVGLSDDEYQRYLSQLATEGPLAGRRAKNEYQWFPLREGADKLDPGIIIGRYADRNYMLLFTDKDHTMLQRSGSLPWSLQAGFGTDSMGRPAIRFDLDPRGSKLMAALTSANTGNSMAIILDDEVHSAPVIRAMIYTFGIIEGNFSATDVSDMVRALNSAAPRKAEVRLSLASVTMRSGGDPPRAGLKRAGLWATGVAVVVLLAEWLVAMIKGYLHLAGLSAILVLLAAMGFWQLVQWNNFAAKYVGNISLVGNGANVLILAVVWFLAARLGRRAKPPVLPLAGETAPAG